MKMVVQKIRGILIPLTEEDEKNLASLNDGAVFEVDIKETDTRTIQQNRAMHKYFTMVANALNASGQYIPLVIKVETLWTFERVKELLWRPVQKKMLGKKTTTKLTKEEVSQVYEVLNRALGERCGISVEFPSREE